MGNIQRFSAINTKVRILERDLLTKEDFRNLISKKTVAEALEYLRDNTVYSTILKDKDIHNLTIEEMELLFKKYIVNQYEKLIHFFTNEYKKLFRIMFWRFEIEDLKLYLRAISRREGTKHLKDLVVYSGMYNCLDYDELSTSNSLEELIEHLKGIVYYDALKPYLDEAPEKRLFYMEMKLDGLYFKRLSEQAEKLEREDREILKELLGKNIDLLNLQWIYRGLKFYKLSPEELINYTLHNGYYLHYKTIKELCYSSSEKDLIDRMLDSKYGFLFDNKDTLELFMERRIERFLYFLFLDYKRKEKMNIIETHVYMHMLEYEMRDIFSVLEAIRYGLEEDKIKQFLIRRI